MNRRSYSWPEGHWDWYRHLAFKHGVRSGRMIFVGGQVDKTPTGEPCNAGDLESQTGVVIAHIARVLAEFGAGLADVTRLVAFYATDGDVDEAHFVGDVGRHVAAFGGAPGGIGPTIVPVPLPWLALPGMRVEIEAVAMLGHEGEHLPRRGVSPADCPPLPAPFQQGVRCAEHVFVGAQTGAGPQAQARTAFSHMAAVLAALDAGPEDLVRIGVWHATPGDRALAGELDALQVASVVLPAARLPSGGGIRVDGWAIRPAHGPAPSRQVSRVPEDWRWPGRQEQIRSVACGDLVFVSGQLPLDSRGEALHPGDLNSQTRLCMERTRAALAAHGLELDQMMKQTSFYLGDADSEDIVTNQRLRSSLYREPAGTSTGVPLQEFGIAGAMVSVDTIAML